MKTQEMVQVSMKKQGPFPFGSGEQLSKQHRQQLQTETEGPQQKHGEVESLLPHEVNIQGDKTEKQIDGVINRDINEAKCLVFAAETDRNTINLRKYGGLTMSKNHAGRGECVGQGRMIDVENVDDIRKKSSKRICCLKFRWCFKTYKRAMLSMFANTVLITLALTIYHILTQGMAQNNEPRIVPVILHPNWTSIKHSYPYSSNISWVLPSQVQFIDVQKHFVEVKEHGTYVLDVLFNINTPAFGNHETYTYLICLKAGLFHEVCQKSVLHKNTAVTVPLKLTTSLHKGDIIWVAVKGADHLYKSSSLNYFIITKFPSG